MKLEEHVWGHKLVVVNGAALTVDRYILTNTNNARLHVFHRVTNFFNQFQIPIMDWSTCTTALNLIDHHWDILDRRLYIIYI